MGKFIILAIVILAAFIIVKRNGEEKGAAERIENTDLPIEGAYQKKWLLSYNEKDAYKALKEICDQNGLYLMTKVRLLDLMEPIKGNKKYKTYFYKIQAKHVDFVICNEKLVARCIVELDDNSHKEADRIKRDKFVDQAVNSVGYTIIHTNGITEDTKAEILKAFAER